MIIEDIITLLLSINNDVGDMRMSLSEKDTLCSREIGELREKLAQEQERIVDAIVNVKNTKVR